MIQLQPVWHGHLWSVVSNIFYFYLLAVGFFSVQGKILFADKAQLSHPASPRWNDKGQANQKGGVRKREEIAMDNFMPGLVFSDMICSSSG